MTLHRNAIEISYNTIPYQHLRPSSIWVIAHSVSWDSHVGETVENIYRPYMYTWGHEAAHHATSRKVACSRTDEVNYFFSIYLSFPGELGPGVYSASNRNEYQKETNNVCGEQSAAGA
jgi:hypothetical protein